MKFNYILALFLCLLFVPSVYAFDNSYLENYFSCGDGISQSVYDSVNEKTLVTWYGIGSGSNKFPYLNTTTGVYGNALYNTIANSDYYGTYRFNIISNSSFYNFGVNDWSISFWSKLNTNDGFRVWLSRFSTDISQPYSTYISIASNTTNVRSINAVYTSSSFTDVSLGSLSNISGININEWFMVTISYSQTDFKYRVYINDQLLLTTNSYNIFDEVDKFLLSFSRDVIIDEISFWSMILNSSSVSQLYNSGDGLNLTAIQSIEGNYTPPISSSYSLYDICIPSIYGNNLCHELVITDGSPSCSFTDLEICSLGCIDDLAYWESLNMSPASMNYSGKCGFCPNPCGYIGQLDCQNDYIMECKQLSNGCLAYQIKTPCIDGCVNGVCNISSVPVGSPSFTELDMFDNLFGISTDTTSNRFLIAIIGIILTGLIGIIFFASFTYMSGTKLPFSIGLILVSSLMLLVFFYFVIIGFIPLWSLILLILVVGLIVGAYFRNKIVGN
jgi:hypothetical protein